MQVEIRGCTNEDLDILLPMKEDVYQARANLPEKPDIYIVNKVPMFFEYHGASTRPCTRCGVVHV